MDTRIHFDIHRNIQFFVNHADLAAKVKDAIMKNRDELYVM